VRSRARLIQHVRSAIKSLGERILPGTAEAFHKRAGASIPEGLREALMPLVAVIEQLTIRIKEYDRKVEQLAEDRYPDTAALMQVCGVGSLTALAYILTLEDEQRYRRSRSVGAWLGLVPGQHDSGESQPQRRITKEGDAYLRRLLVGCAQYILGPFASDSDLRRHGLLIAARGGSNAKKRAVVALAPSLSFCCVCTEYMLRHLSDMLSVQLNHPASDCKVLTAVPCIAPSVAAPGTLVTADFYSARLS
jgi:transposase